MLSSPSHLPRQLRSDGAEEDDRGDAGPDEVRQGGAPEEVLDRPEEGEHEDEEDVQPLPKEGDGEGAARPPMAVSPSTRAYCTATPGSPAA